jgi:hypothetical protein
MQCQVDAGMCWLMTRHATCAAFILWWPSAAITIAQFDRSPYYLAAGLIAPAVCRILHDLNPCREGRTMVGVWKLALRMLETRMLRSDTEQRDKHISG